MRPGAGMDEMESGPGGAGMDSMPSPELVLARPLERDVLGRLPRAVPAHPERLTPIRGGDSVGRRPRPDPLAPGRILHAHVLAGRVVGPVNNSVARVQACPAP